MPCLLCRFDSPEPVTATNTQFSTLCLPDLRQHLGNYHNYLHGAVTCVFSLELGQGFGLGIGE